MPEYNSPDNTQYEMDLNSKIRNLEEKQKLLKERILLIGKNLIEDKEENIIEMQEIKKTLIKLKEENLRMKEFVQRISEQLSESARKEELMILQRQLDILNPK
jgi:hypothetical protein